MSIPCDVTEIPAWQLAHKLNLRVDLFLLSPDFRRHYKHADGLSRAVRSGPEVIAAGFDRGHTAFADCVRRAKSAHAEVVHHLVVAHDQGLISGDELEISRQLARRAIKAANGLLRSLEVTNAGDEARRVKRRSRPPLRSGPRGSD